jgi:hypothetical protein
VASPLLWLQKWQKNEIIEANQGYYIKTVISQTVVMTIG